MKEKLFISVIISFILFWSCSTTPTVVNKEDGKIISLLIDKLASPLIPPPTSTDTTHVIPQKLIDSVNLVKLKIWVHPEMEGLSKEYLSKLVPIEILSNFKQKDDSNKIIINNIANISSTKGHNITVADTVQLKETIDFNGADQLFNFSRIFYNEKQDALLIDIGISHSRLAGSSGVYYLKNNQGEWKIMDYYEGVIW